MGLVVVDGYFLRVFGASQGLEASEELLSLGRSRGGVLPEAPIESSGEGLLRIQGDWRHPGDGRFVSEMWVRDGVVEKVFMGLGRLGDFLGAIASFELSGVGLLVGVWSVICLTRRRVEDR